MSERSVLFAEKPELEELPDWYASDASAQFEIAANADAPKGTDEAWRFGKLKEVRALAELKPAQAVADVSSLDLEYAGLKEVSARFVFANDGLVSGDVESLEQGVIVCSIAEAFEQHADLLRKHMLKQDAKLGSENFAALHRAHLKNGVFVYVPAGKMVEKPIEIHHWVAGDGVVSFPHTLVVAEQDARVDVLEHFHSADDAENGVVGMVDLVAEKNAHVSYAAAQLLNRSSRMMQFQNVLTAEGAEATAAALQLGSAWSRQQSVSRVTGREAKANMLAAVVASGDQAFDSRTLQIHDAPGATSDLLYKNALFDKSHNVFSGLIIVEPGAHETDAYQTCRNLLNSDVCEAHSMPGLEIHADDVECSHGSTSGQIEKDELFYLLARGITEKQARHLIARGFLADVVKRLPNKATREYLENMIEQALRRAED